MKVQLVLKDPDGVWESLKVVEEGLREKIVEKFITYWEFVCIEIDTETLEAKVVERR